MGKITRMHLLLSCFTLLSFYVHAQGVKVIAPLTVNNPSDVYPTHIDTLGNGGYMSVSTLSSRNSISQLRRKKGMMVYVNENDSTYQLVGGLENRHWVPVLVKSVSLSWKGSLPTAPASPQLNWAYYNSIDKKSYVWDGDSWELLAQDGQVGENGVSISWRGSLPTAPASPQLNWAYYNSTDKKSYVWDSDSWELLAQDGATGAAGSNGISISWRGSLATAPASPQLNWAYYNSTDKKSYVWDGDSWELLAQDGATGAAGSNGISISWRGSLATAPASPQMNWAYYNSTDKKSYVWDGDSWELLAQDGATGAAGNNGISINWQGSLAAAPASPQMNWAYYNSTDKKSYVWDGDSWELLVADGKGIVWLGSLEEEPTNPEMNWAYYSIPDQMSLIYDGEDWQTLTYDGGQGAPGVSIVWKGSAADFPTDPEMNWAFYHTGAKTSFIWDGNSWEILAKDGADAADALGIKTYKTRFQPADFTFLANSDKDFVINTSITEDGFEGGVVVVSPNTPLPEGVVISWTRVEAGTKKAHFRLRNTTGADINMQDLFFVVVVIYGFSVAE